MVITGRIGYLATFVGTTLLAISSQFGFIAPVLAADAPAALEEIILYWPVVFFNAVAVITFITGYVALGLAASASSFFARWSGYSMAIGAPVHLVGSGSRNSAHPRSGSFRYSAASRWARVSPDAVIACGPPRPLSGTPGGTRTPSFKPPARRVARTGRDRLSWGQVLHAVKVQPVYILLSAHCLGPPRKAASLRTGLLIHDGLNWPRRRDRIGVTMDDPPRIIFPSKYGCHAQRS